MARLSRLLFGDLAVEESVDIEILDTLRGQVSCCDQSVCAARRGFLVAEQDLPETCSRLVVSSCTKCRAIALQGRQRYYYKHNRRFRLTQWYRTQGSGSEGTLGRSDVRFELSKDLTLTLELLRRCSLCKFYAESNVRLNGCCSKRYLLTSHKSQSCLQNSRR